MKIAKKDTQEEWTTSREDLLSYTMNPETGEECQFVVYVYREPEQRIAIFGKKAREDAELISKMMNARRLLEPVLRELHKHSKRSCHTERLAAVALELIGVEP